jgi:hypothetical protein
MLKMNDNVVVSDNQVQKARGNRSGETHFLTAEIAEAAEASEKPVSQGWNTENSALSAYSAVKMMWTSERLRREHPQDKRPTPVQSFPAGHAPPPSGWAGETPRYRPGSVGNPHR